MSDVEGQRPFPLGIDISTLTIVNDNKPNSRESNDTAVWSMAGTNQHLTILYVMRQWDAFMTLHYICYLCGG